MKPFVVECGKSKGKGLPLGQVKTFEFIAQQQPWREEEQQHPFRLSGNNCLKNGNNFTENILVSTVIVSGFAFKLLSLKLL